MCGALRIRICEVSGSFFNWNNKQEGRVRVYAKLDRVIANVKWVNKYGNAEVMFFPKGEFDHSPFLVTIYPIQETRKPFRYFNFWSSYKDFHRKVAEIWNEDTIGTPMYYLVSKLKRLRVVLTKINREGTGDVFAESEKYKMMIAIEEKIKEDPGNIQLMDEEITIQEEYQQAHKDMIQFLKQKVKIAWLKEGDENTIVFHISIRSRCIQNSIYSIWDMKGNWIDNQEGVGQDFKEFYEALLGTV
ncbi:uncharacterized protein LOC133824069 [Humulus lupulus]|uniref:uncharacterized protein LOC133824069 n=1 Tax=Humulus lupulus TaxID=3486 RepID=UPI002B417F05|nr:uncharacterized protein LOC133824069 [Humulus lupulus]